MTFAKPQLDECTRETASDRQNENSLAGVFGRKQRLRFNEKKRFTHQYTEHNTSPPIPFDFASRLLRIPWLVETTLIPIPSSTTGISPAFL